VRSRRISTLSAVAVAAVCVAATTAPADTGGAFAIGDGSSAPGSSVEFWGAQWWKLNSVSGGTVPASFKGYAVMMDPTGPCTGTFASDPGNSSDPPATLTDPVQALVTSDVTKSGPVISGDYTDIVLVSPNPGYEPDPGHPGTGTVIRSACGGGAPPG